MHFKEIEIENLFSFESVKFQFEKYNVIVGANNAGKTNLLRILKHLSDSNSLDGFNISKNIKFDPEKKSRLTLSLILTDEEIRIMLEALFQQSIKKTEFPNSLKLLKIIISWMDTVDDNPHPLTVNYIFGNGLTFITQGGEAGFIFDLNCLSDDKKETSRIITDLSSFDYNQIIHKLKDNHQVVENNSLGEVENLIKLLIEDKNIESYFVKSPQKFLSPKRPTFQFDYQNQTDWMSEICDYLLQKKDAVRNMPFSELIQRIIKNGLVIIEEIYPAYDKLTNSLFTLKSVREDAYEDLKKAFSSIYEGMGVKVEQDLREEQTKRIILTENSRKFNIEESASGHYAAIHLLHIILNKPNCVLLLDEPEMHFHPIKIRQFGQKLMELSSKSNNQIIIISHSPKFIDYKLLDPSQSFNLAVVTKNEHKSKLNTKPKSFQFGLSPHLFNPEIFFGKCTMIVEGADDEFTLRAISDYFDGIFDKHNITILNCWGVGHIFPNTQLHTTFDLPFVAMVDNDYENDETNVVKLEGKLEDEFKKLGWEGSKNDLKPDVAYQYIVDLLKKEDGLKQLKTTGIWNAFTMVLEKVGAKVP